MKQAWRWFGPEDPVSLEDIRQAGASEIVTALHGFAPGAVWTRQAVAERKALIEDTPKGRTPLVWRVVESIPVPDAIKLHGASAREAVEAWCESLAAVAANGIRLVCYNFMPVVDWTRTDLDYKLPSGATCLRFDADKFAAFDLFLLEREGAEAEYDAPARARAKAAFAAMSAQERQALVETIAAALPGSTTQSLTLPGFRAKLEAYRGIDAAALRANLIGFLQAVTPLAEKLGVRLTLHPDDPPRPLFGLPRIASHAQDYRALFAAVPSEANGMCFCTGSLGVDARNDLSEIAREFAPRIHFVHLRATKREANPLSFHEADHLAGDVDMVSVLRVLLAENTRRGAGADAGIPFRPDHGHRMLDDLNKRTNPGYSAIGRLKGLAELRGVITALQAGA